MELVGNNLQGKSVTLDRVKEGCAFLICGKGQRGETAMPVMDRDGVAITDAEMGRFIEESAGERVVVSKVATPPEGTWLADAVQNDRIAGLVTLIDVVSAPRVGVVCDQAKLPAGC